MRYPDGQEARLGDVVTLGGDARGVVVCSIDTDEFTADHPASEWRYLGTGVMIHFDRYGLIHYREPEDDLVLVSRVRGDTA